MSCASGPSNKKVKPRPAGIKDSKEGPIVVDLARLALLISDTNKCYGLE